MDDQQDHYSFLIPEDSLFAMSMKQSRDLEELFMMYPGITFTNRADTYAREISGPRGIVSKLEYAYRTIVIMGPEWPVGMVGFFWDAELNVNIHAVEHLDPQFHFPVPSAIVWAKDDDLTTLVPDIKYITYNIIWRLDNVGIYIRQY